MSVIIRLQNLPWSANALDIRQFFRGLSIPEGGVHIVGGELGDAFIAFSTDEDARQAFQLNSGKIKEVQIKLLLSSRTEMQKVIEAARNVQTPFAASVAIPTAVPPLSAVQAGQDLKKEDLKSKDDSKSSSKSRDRRRTRSRSRSRDRKDRSRDRRDRRRRDRSRSRDRRDRRRDRRDRSKSRERTRSRDRDSRRSKDKKKDNVRMDEKNVDLSSSGSTSNTDLNEQQKPLIVPWEKNTRLPLVGNNSPQIAPGLLGNYPGQVNTSLEDARRSLGLITGLQNIISGQPNNMNLPNDMNGGFQRNDMNMSSMNRDNRDTWQNNKGRFQDRNPMMDKVGGGMGGQFPQNLPRPFLAQNNDLKFMGNQGNLSNLFQNQPMQHMPFNSDNGNNNINRQFLNRPGTLIQDSIQQQNRNVQNDFQFGSNNDNEHFRKDPRANMSGNRNEPCCVQLRPYFGGYGEVRRFFHGLYINNSGIKFITDNTGKRNGTIFIRFVHPVGRVKALLKSGTSLRNVIVEITPLDEEEFERFGGDEHESDEEKEDKKEQDDNPYLNKTSFTCLVIDDLPVFAKETDILKMFANYTLVGIHLVVNKHNHQMAFVQFNTEEDAEKALNEKSKHFLGLKPVNVRPCSDKMFLEAKKEHTEDEKPVEMQEPIVQNDRNNSPASLNHPDNNQFPPKGPNFSSDVVLLTGMPYKTTDRDVIDFFSDIGLVPTRIHMLLGKFGPSGECYCEFATSEEISSALDKNGMPLGTGVVRVEPFSRRDMERNLGFPLAGSPINHNQNARFLGRLGPRPGIMGMRPLLGNNMMRHLQNPMNRFDGPVDNNNMGMPGCIISMENVPFKAGVDEIIDFFENFDVANHNVLRRYNDNGTPTGDARVTFNSPNEARRALEACRYRKIRDRTIYLRLI